MSGSPRLVSMYDRDPRFRWWTEPLVCARCFHDWVQVRREDATIGECPRCGADSATVQRNW